MHASWVAMARQRIATLLPAANLDADPFPLTKSGQRWLVHVPAPSSLAHSWHTAHGTLEIWYVHQLAQHPFGLTCFVAALGCLAALPAQCI